MIAVLICYNTVSFAEADACICLGYLYNNFNACYIIVIISIRIADSYLVIAVSILDRCISYIVKICAIITKNTCDICLDKSLKFSNSIFCILILKVKNILAIFENNFSICAETDACIYRFNSYFYFYFFYIVIAIRIADNYSVSAVILDCGVVLNCISKNCAITINNAGNSCIDARFKLFYCVCCSLIVKSESFESGNFCRLSRNCKSSLLDNSIIVCTFYGIAIFRIIVRINYCTNRMSGCCLRILSFCPIYPLFSIEELDINCTKLGVYRRLNCSIAVCPVSYRNIVAKEVIYCMLDIVIYCNLRAILWINLSFYVFR